ncbi:MAG: aldolase, partial [Methylophilaceae bacterium]
MEAASKRMKKHALNTSAHTLIFDLEDGCRQKEMSRELLRQELPAFFEKKKSVSIAVRINPFRTDEYEKDI